MMFRLTEEELVVVIDECGENPAKDHFYVMVLKTQLKKIADKIEDMANDGDSVGDVLKALREET